jgi:hypothetical protein
MALYYKTWLQISANYMVIPRPPVHIKLKLQFKTFTASNNEISACYTMHTTNNKEQFYIKCLDTYFKFDK